VAADNGSKVDSKVNQEREERRRQREPILLRRRDNSVVEEPPRLRDCDSAAREFVLSQ